MELKSLSKATRFCSTSVSKPPSLSRVLAPSCLQKTPSNTRDLTATHVFYRGFVFLICVGSFFGLNFLFFQLSKVDFERQARRFLHFFSKTSKTPRKIEHRFRPLSGFPHACRGKTPFGPSEVQPGPEPSEKEG